MKNYTIKELASLAHISTRTLRFYEEIQLLKPSGRLDSGERYYSEKEQLRLQQILFYKELDIELSEIKNILDAKDFDTLKALKEHKKVLEEKSLRMSKLIKTIDKTILYLNGKTMLKNDDLYEGFTKDQIEEMEKEAKDKWGPMFDDVNKKVRSWSKEKFNEIKDEGFDVAKKLSELMDKDPSHEDVQKQVHRHFKNLQHFYEPTYEIYKGLAEMYVSDGRFKKFYDKHKEGLAEFLKKGMHHYAEKHLKK